jgi:phage FluMu protein Com
MLEKRCPKCNHLFFKVQLPMQWAKTLTIEIKCPKCKEIHKVTHHEDMDYSKS